MACIEVKYIVHKQENALDRLIAFTLLDHPLERAQINVTRHAARAFMSEVLIKSFKNDPKESAAIFLFLDQHTKRLSHKQEPLVLLSIAFIWQMFKFQGQDLKFQELDLKAERKAVLTFIEQKNNQVVPHSKFNYSALNQVFDFLVKKYQDDFIAGATLKSIDIFRTVFS